MKNKGKQAVGYRYEAVWTVGFDLWNVGNKEELNERIPRAPEPQHQQIPIR